MQYERLFSLIEINECNPSIYSTLTDTRYNCQLRLLVYSSNVSLFNCPIVNVLTPVCETYCYTRAECSVLFSYIHTYTHIHAYNEYI